MIDMIIPESIREEIWSSDINQRMMAHGKFSWSSLGVWCTFVFSIRTCQNVAQNDLELLPHCLQSWDDSIVSSHLVSAIHSLPLSGGFVGLLV